MKKNYDFVIAACEQAARNTPQCSFENLQAFGEQRRPCASSILMDDLQHEKMEDIFGEFSVSQLEEGDDIRCGSVGDIRISI